MTDILLPQSPADSRQYGKEIDADGNLVFQQVDIAELSYRGRYGAVTSSSSSNTISIGDKYFRLDDNEDNFRVGDDILLTAMDDPASCYMWGEIVAKDTVEGPARIRVFTDDISNLSGTFSWWEIQVVARPKPGIEKDTSTTSVNPTTGGPWTFTVTVRCIVPGGNWT